MNLHLSFVTALFTVFAIDLLPYRRNNCEFVERIGLTVISLLTLPHYCLFIPASLTVPHTVVARW